MYNFLGIIFQIEKSWCNVRVGIFAFPTLVDFAGKTLMLHLCMQASFLKDMQNSGILLESFRQNMNAIYKILREVACNLKNYKNFPESCKFLQKLKTMLFFPAGFIYKNELFYTLGCLWNTFPESEMRFFVLLSLQVNRYLIMLPTWFNFGKIWSFTVFCIKLVTPWLFFKNLKNLKWPWWWNVFVPVKVFYIFRCA